MLADRDEEGLSRAVAELSKDSNEIASVVCDVADVEQVKAAAQATIGGGAVGLLVAYCLWKSQGRPVPLVEVHAKRAELAEGLPWIEAVLAPEQASGAEKHVAFHASGHGEGLQTALDAVGFEGRVVELSWYGTREVTLALGGDFHYRRKRIQASQVAIIAPARRSSCAGP